MLATETIHTLSLHACAEGDILPLAFLPATAAPSPYPAHGAAVRPLPDGNRDWRIGTCLFDASGTAEDINLQPSLQLRTQNIGRRLQN